MRIQFYPMRTLEERLIHEAEQQGTSVSTLVNDILNKHFGLVPSTSLTNAALQKQIFGEIATFVLQQPSGTEFDLNTASPTFQNIEMVYAGKPSIIRAQIGKRFRTAYVGLIPPFLTVSPVILPNGSYKRSLHNRAAVYVVN